MDGKGSFRALFALAAASGIRQGRASVVVRIITIGTATEEIAP